MSEQTKEKLRQAVLAKHAEAMWEVQRNYIASGNAAPIHTLGYAIAAELREIDAL